MQSASGVPCGFIWRIGDTAYYLGLLASVMTPVIAYSRFKAPGIAIALFLLCFPAGLALSIGLKSIARHYTGVGH